MQRSNTSTRKVFFSTDGGNDQGVVLPDNVHSSTSPKIAMLTLHAVPHQPITTSSSHSINVEIQNWSTTAENIFSDMSQPYAQSANSGNDQGVVPVNSSASLTVTHPFSCPSHSYSMMTFHSALQPNPHQPIMTSSGHNSIQNNNHAPPVKQETFEHSMNGSMDIPISSFTDVPIKEEPNEPSPQMTGLGTINDHPPIKQEPDSFDLQDLNNSNYDGHDLSLVPFLSISNAFDDDDDNSSSISHDSSVSYDNSSISYESFTSESDWDQDLKTDHDVPVVPFLSTPLNAYGRLSHITSARTGDINHAANHTSASFSAEKGSTVPWITYDVLHQVKHWLDPRSLLNLSYTCQAMQNCYSMEDAVRSAMMKGGHSLTSMKELHDLIKVRSIWPLKAKRILLIACGGFCEVCRVRKVNHVRKHLGMFVCWHCMTARGWTVAYTKEGDHFENNAMAINELLGHSRMTQRRYGYRIITSLIHSQIEWAERKNIDHGWGRLNGDDDELEIKDLTTYYFKKQMVDSDGDPVGPLFTYDRIKSILDDPFYLTEAMFEPDEVIQSNLLEMGAPAEDDKRYQDFVKTFEKYESIARSRDAERREQRMMAADRYVMKKQVAATKAIEKIKKYADDPNISHLFNHRVNKNFSNPYLRKKYKQRPIKMSVFWVERLFRNMLSAPSKLSSKELRDLARALKRGQGEEKNKRDLGRLGETYKTLLKYYYEESDGFKNFYCH